MLVLRIVRHPTHIAVFTRDRGPVLHLCAIGFDSDTLLFPVHATCVFPSFLAGIYTDDIVLAGISVHVNISTKSGA